MNCASALSRTETWRLLALVGACFGLLASMFQADDDNAPLIASFAFSGIAFALTFSLIRWLSPVFVKAGLKGKDMAKTGRPEMYTYALLHFLYRGRMLLLIAILDRKRWEQSVQLYTCCF